MWTILLVGCFKLCNVEKITQLWNRLFLADSGIGGEACPGTGFHSEQREGGHPRASRGQRTCSQCRGPEAPNEMWILLALSCPHRQQPHLGAPRGAPNALQAKELRQRTYINAFSKYWAMSIMCLKDLHFRKVAQSGEKPITLGLFDRLAPFN